MVQILLGLENLYSLWNMGGSHFRGFDCTQIYVNAFGTKRSVCIIIDGHFSGMSIRQGSIVI